MKQGRFRNFYQFYHWKVLTSLPHCIIRICTIFFVWLVQVRFVHEFTILATRIVSQQNTHMYLHGLWLQQIRFSICKALALPVPHENSAISHKLSTINELGMFFYEYDICNITVRVGLLLWHDALNQDTDDLISEKFNMHWIYVMVLEYIVLSWWQSCQHGTL